MPIPATFTWLHFSDLHWGSKKTENYWATVKEHLFDDIRKQIRENSLTIDAIFFTGDLVNWGTAEQYTDFNTDWLTRLESFFKGQGMNPFFLAVPGNHDLKRPRKESSDSRILRDNWDNDAKVREEFWNDADNPGHRQLVKEVFGNYLQWWCSPDRPLTLSTQPNITLKHGFFPGDFACTLPLQGGGDPWLPAQAFPGEGAEKGGDPAFRISRRFIYPCS